MGCDNIQGHLSLYLDEMLDEERRAEVSRHLRGCEECARESARLASLRRVLRDLQRVEAPDYLHSLVEMRVGRERHRSWASSIRAAWEYRWSRIRTTEGLWYLTRLVGAMATVVLFVTIYSAMNPLYLGFGDPAHDRWSDSSSMRPQQLGIGVLNALGLPPVELQRKPIRASDPKINDEYLLDFSKSVENSSPREGEIQTVSLLTVVDSKGAAKIQDVLEYPKDDSLLNAFAEMIMSAGWRPASQDGRAVDSRLVLTYSTIWVRN